MSKILVIGAQNIDLFAKTNQPYVLGDSNIATIHMAFGGVGRNITENLVRLGNDVSFITVFGSDHLSKTAKSSLIEMGVDVSHSRTVENSTANMYLAIMDEQNDLYLGLNDMPLQAALTTSYLKEKDTFIDTYNDIVIDNNLPEKVIGYLLKTYRHKRIYIDCVSAKKAYKLQSYLEYIYLLKVNHLEIEALSTKETIPMKITSLLTRGVQGILISNKEATCAYHSIEQVVTKEPIQTEQIVNATGAGDGFISGFIHEMAQQKTIEEALDCAIKVAYITLQSDNSTNELLSIDEVKNIE